MLSLADEAEKFLLSQFSSSSKLKALLRSLVEPFQELMDEINEYVIQSIIKKAVPATVNTKIQVGFPEEEGK